jgi:hypothetical protein
LACPLMTVSKELSNYKSDFVGLQEVRWDEVGAEPAMDYTSSAQKGNEAHELCTSLFLHKKNHIGS